MHFPGHQVSDFKAKMHQIRFRLDLRGPTSKGERGGDGREKRLEEVEGKGKGGRGEGGTCSKVLGGDRRPCI